MAKGYSHRQKVDFEELFSPVARLETVRVLLAISSQQQWPIYQLDVKSAFLNGEVQEDVFVDQLEGFVIEGSKDKVYKLRKALYGLKQAPRAWYSRIDHYFIHHGFERSVNEPTLYKKKEKGSNDMLLVCLYIDDIIYLGSSQLLIDEFKA